MQYVSFLQSLRSVQSTFSDRFVNEIGGFVGEGGEKKKKKRSDACLISFAVV